jgi:molecular chaperone GrpE
MMEGPGDARFPSIRNNIRRFCLAKEIEITVLEDQIEDPQTEGVQTENGQTGPEAPETHGENEPHKRDDYLDHLQRLQAEFANYRRRTEREREQLGDHVRGEVCRQLLPVLDDLERALTHSREDETSLRPGVELVYRNLKSTLESLGLKAIVSLEQSFDPQLHEAVMVQTDPDADEETVVEELQRGYTFKERLLRPARVKVAKAD